MNYYRRYSGDYLRDTARLSLIEHGAYCLMLDYYYSDEQPLPASKDEIYLLVRAMRPEDRKAVDKVLDRFFTLTSDGYRNERADHEISASKQARTNGKSGGRPKTGKQTGSKTGSITDNETGEETGSKTGEGGGLGHPPTTNLQPPNHQPPTSSNSAAGKPVPEPPAGGSAPLASPSDDNPDPIHTEAGRYAKELRALGVTVGSTHPTLHGWIRDRIPLQRCVEAVEAARMNGKPLGTNIPANYLDRVIRDVAPKAGTMPRSDEDWCKWGAKHALPAKVGEAMSAYVGRLRSEFTRRAQA